AEPVARAAEAPEPPPRVPGALAALRRRALLAPPSVLPWEQLSLSARVSPGPAPLAPPAREPASELEGRGQAMWRSKPWPPSGRRGAHAAREARPRYGNSLQKTPSERKYRNRCGHRHVALCGAVSLPIEADA